MLKSNEHGYAVMNKELTAYSFDHFDLETCKKYCRSGDVVAKRIPYVCGVEIRITFHKWSKPICFGLTLKNILWLHWSMNKVYAHRTGEVVYRNFEFITGL